MEKKPLNNDQISRPGYPTLSEVKSASKGKTIVKVAAVTAVVGTLSLTTACGDMISSLFGRGRGEIAGDVMTSVPVTEETSEVIMGEETFIDPTDETTETTTEATTEATTEGSTKDTSEWLIEGEEECFTDQTVLDGDVIIFTTETT